MKLTNTKVIISGSIIEVYKYEEHISYDFQSQRNNESAPIQQESDDKNKTRADSLARSVAKLRRIINSNSNFWKEESGQMFSPVFLTLTFKENLKDPNITNILFSKFIKRLNYHVTSFKKSYLKYAVVIEFQKRGAVHYHVIFFNLKFLPKKEIANLWRYGFVKINKINKVDNIGAYMTKYMSKDFIDDRLNGRKRYFISRNLIKPIIIRDEQTANKVLESLSEEDKTYENEYTSKYQGKVNYKQFNLGNQKTILINNKEVYYT